MSFRAGNTPSMLRRDREEQQTVWHGHRAGHVRRRNAPDVAAAMGRPMCIIAALGARVAGRAGTMETTENMEKNT